MRENFTHRALRCGFTGVFHWHFEVFHLGIGFAKEKFRNPFDSRKDLFRFQRLSPDKTNNNTTEL
jgi:hypothetical protein